MTPLLKRRRITALFWGAISLTGMVFFAIFLSQPSEAGNQFLFGLSRARAGIALVFLFLLLGCLAITALSAAPGWWNGQEQIEARMDNLLSTRWGQFAALTLLYLTLLASGALLLLNFIPLAKPVAFLGAVISRLDSMFAWVFIASILLIGLLLMQYAETIQKKGFLTPPRLTFWGLLLLATYTLLLSDYRQAAFVLSLRGAEIPLIWLGGFFLLAAGLGQRFSGSAHRETLNNILLLSAIFLTTFVIYTHIAAWIDWVDKSHYAYWNLLAGQFLRGRLYLENPPTTHDLTFVNGNWYIPMPPLPAIVMLPLAALLGNDNINTGVFSIFFSALNSVLIFLILDALILRKWIKLSRQNALWLVVLFAFGTVHLWVGLNGRAWFVSQILTVTFLALAVFAALKSWSPWLIGACLGLAMAARPNGILTWPFVFAIAMQIKAENGDHIDLRKIFAWTLKSALPIAAAIVGLLLYNHARFNNFFDFGYTSLEGDPLIVENARTFGVFSPHFIFQNIQAMLLTFPTIQLGAQWPILPSTVGMNIFLTTPPLLYLIHRYERRCWILGAWATVLLNFVLLVMYHNTGAHQFGYRYILDTIAPLMALLAVALNKKIRWHFYILLIFSILFNIYGANWFMNG